MQTSITRTQYNFSRQTSSIKKVEKPCDTETVTIIEEAKAMGINWRLVPNTEFLELEYKGKKSYCRHSSPFSNSVIGSKICIDKSATNAFLREAGVSVNNWFIANIHQSETEWGEIFDSLQKPLVIKPIDGTHGAGVILNINDKEAFITQLKESFAKLVPDRENVPGEFLLVEEMFQGSEYRVLVSSHRLIGIMNRIPANVIGNGTSTIQQLIDKKNQDPLRNIDQNLYPRLTIDDNMKYVLSKNNLTLESVPSSGQHIQLREVSNIMAGGDAVDCTDIVHPSVKEIAEKTIAAIPGLSFAGLDFMTKDITQPQDATTYRIIEVNSSPEFTMHDIPMVGLKRGAAQEFLLLHFPELRASFTS